MEFTVSDLVNRLDELLNDSGRVRWPLVTRQRWILDAQQAIVAAEAKAGAVGTEQVVLTADRPKQRPAAWTATAFRALHDITHNVVGGNLRDTIRYLSRAQLDAQRPNWMREPTGTIIKYWMPIENEPEAFYVYPVPKTGVTVLAQTSYYPTTADAEVLGVRAEFKNAVLHLAAAYCWMKDDTPGDRENVMTHLQLAGTSLQAAGMADDKVITKIVTRTPPK